MSDQDSLAAVGNPAKKASGHQPADFRRRQAQQLCGLGNAVGNFHTVKFDSGMTVLSRIVSGACYFLIPRRTLGAWTVVRPSSDARR